MIRIGTSGFSYDDWLGPVYPAGLPARDQLAFYAREFSTVELNVTYYRVPDARTVAGWARKTPDDFLFSVKAYQGLTHERTAPDFAGFVSALQPLVAAGKLGCVLAQFPYSFHPVPENRDYLRRLRDGLGGLPVVVEFRNAGWVTPQTFELLRSLALGFCSVDEPRLKGSDAAGCGRDGAGRLCPFPRPQRGKVVCPRRGLGTLRLHLLDRRTARVGAEAAGAGCRGAADPGLLQ